MSSKFITGSARWAIIPDGKLLWIEFVAENFYSARDMGKFSFFITSQGNEAMREIAQAFIQTLTQEGHQADLRMDVLPPEEKIPDFFPIIVAPHEYDELFVRRQHPDANPWRSSFLLCVEQPGSPWFNQALQVAGESRGVLDIHPVAAAEHRREGIKALHWPIPFIAPESPPRPHTPADRPLDFIFMGSGSKRRQQFLSEHAEFFGRYDNRLLLSNPVVPRQAGMAGCAFGKSRDELLQRAKIFLNVHGFESSYFEWHRALAAISNGCLLLTETSEGFAPLAPDKDFVMAAFPDLRKACEYWITHPELRQQLTDSARRRVEEQLGGARLYRNAAAQLEKFSRQRMAPDGAKSKLGWKIFQGLIKRHEFIRRWAQRPRWVNGWKFEPVNELIRRFNGFSSLGNDPQFLIRPPGGIYPAGRCRIAVRLKTRLSTARPAIYYDTGNGFNGDQIILLPELFRENPQSEAWFDLPPGVVGMRFDPMSCPAEFQLVDFQMEPGGERMETAPEDKAQDIAPKMQAEMICMKSQQREQRLDALKAVGQPLFTQTPNAAYAGQTPQVSVVITTYNYRRFIPSCLDSVLATKLSAGLKNFEIIVVDDASPENESDLASRHLSASAVPALVVRNQVNCGGNRARNIGIDLARAPFVFSLDADNLILPACLSTLYDFACAHELDAAYGMLARFLDETGAADGFQTCYEWNPQWLLLGPYIDTMALFRKETLVKAGRYHESLELRGVSGMQDYELWLRLSRRQAKVRLWPNVVARYRVHPDSLTLTRQHLANHSIKKLLAEHEQLLMQAKLDRNGHPAGASALTGV